MIITDINKLRQICKPASKIEAIEIIEFLDKELQEINKYGICGIGLAAPQIGIDKRVAIIRIGNIKIDLVNCSIAEQYDIGPSKEGCLSIPGKTCIVDRYNEIIIKDNYYGNINNFVCYGMVSIASQHELNHFDGMLMIDKAIPEHINIGDNMECHCGSRKKYKHCCKKRGQNELKRTN